MQHRLRKLPDGTLSQSGLAKIATDMGHRPSGLKLSAVVVATYVFDEPNGANVVGTPVESRAVYCDAVCIHPRFHGIPIPRALVLQSQAGLHSGEIWIPEPASREQAGETVNKSLATNLSNTDGAHVVVEFLNDDFAQPIITGALPHPIADLGNSDRLIGHRTRPVVGDGKVRLTKHRGSWFGLDDAGNLIVDLTRAHDGQLEADLSEPAPALDGQRGNYKVRIPEGSVVELEITKGAQEGDGSDSDAESTKVRIENNRITVLLDGGEGWELVGKDADTTSKVGDGAVSIAIADHLQTFWDQTLKPRMDAFDAAIQAHTHLYIFGSTGPASAGTPPTIPMTFPAYDQAITSTKNKITDG